MEPIVYSLPLDAGQTGAQALLHVRQGDARSRCFRFRLTQGGTAYPVADAVSAVLRGSKPDGTILYEDCEIRDGIIRYTLTEALTAAQGTVECELTLYGANATVLSSPKFEIYVDGSAYPDGYVSSTSAFTALQGAMTDVQGLFTEVEGLIEDVEAAIAAGDDARGHAEQTALDRAATGADRTAVNAALTGFTETTLPNAIQAVEDKADEEILRVAAEGDTQVENVQQAVAEQVGIAEGFAIDAGLSKDNAKDSENESKSYAVGGTNTREGEDTDNSKYYKQIAAQALTDLLAMLGSDIATLTDGKLTPSQIPALSINDVFPVASEAELLMLTAERGDCGIIVVDNAVTDSYILAADDPAQLENWKKLGASYVANAGHANTADSATDAQKVNGHRVVTFATVAEMESAVKVDGTLYFAPYEEG